MSFVDLTSPAGLKAFDEYIAAKSYIQGYIPTTLDVQAVTLMGKAPSSQYPHALRYFNVISSYNDNEKKQFRAGAGVPEQISGSTKAPAVKGAAPPKSSAKSAPATSPAPAAAAAAPAASSADIAAIEQKIAEQGDVVRKLKEEKASKDAITAEVQKLLALKEELKAAGGVLAPPAKQEKKKGGDNKKEEPKKEEPKKEEGGKKGKKDKKKGGDKKEGEGKKEGGKKEGDKKHDPKFLKTVEKEGGKKGQDILGVYEMGGLEFFCTTIDTPDGDLDLMEIVLDNMNKEIDENSEEKRGGAGPVGKMLFSAGVDQLGMIARVPEDKIAKINTKDWMAHVCKQLQGELQPGATDALAKGVVLADKEKGRFPLKMKDDAIAAAIAYLRERKCFPDNDDESDDEFVYGDDDFDDAF